MELVLTCEEGQTLLKLAASFSLPDKLGDNSYNVGDRGLAAEEVREFYRELRKHSPLLTGSLRQTCFGPESNFQDVKTPNGVSIGQRLLNPALEIPVNIDEDVKSGAIWCLIVATHPMSSLCQPVGVQSDVLWPLADKLKCHKALKEAIGLDKAKPRRWVYDGQEKQDEKK